MTHHASQGMAVLVWVVYLCLLGAALLPSRGLMAQSHNVSRTAPALVEALNDVDVDVRRRAAAALGRMMPTAHEAVPALSEALNDVDVDVRRAAAGALRRMGSAASRAIPALIEALKDVDVDVRRAAAGALGVIWPAASGAVPALSEALEETDSSVRRVAAEALGRMGSAARGAIPMLVKALKDADADVRLVAANALGTIALAARDARATHMISPLKGARNALSALADPNLRDQTATVNSAIEFLELLWWRDLRERLWQWMDEHRYVSAAVAVYPILLLWWLALHGLRPLWLYRINEALKLYTDFALPAQLGGIKIPLRHVLLVGCFHYSRRMLDAWVTQHLTTTRAEFQRKGTVRDRAVHIPVPVVLDGQVIPHLSAEQLRPTFNQNLACLLIWGEGGGGKTSLACQMARWAMADTPMERLCAQHYMLRVLIEQALELRDAEHPHPFTDAIRGELRALTHQEDPIPEAFLLQLLQRRRVLVIVDHFSEMPEATRQEIRPGQPEFPANALVVTSRLDEQRGGVSPTTVQRFDEVGVVLKHAMQDHPSSRPDDDAAPVSHDHHAPGVSP